MDRQGYTTTTITLVDADAATTKRIAWTDGPTEATVTIDVDDRVDHVHTGEGRTWITPADAGYCGLDAEWAGRPIVVGQTYRQPHSRGHKLTVVATQQDARDAARAYVIDAVGRAVVAGAVVALRDVFAISTADLDALDSEPV
jgi:hypothetical protein